MKRISNNKASEKTSTWLVLFVLLLAIQPVFIACHKEELNADKSVLIGKWNWKYSEHIYNQCTKYNTFIQTISPTSNGNNYTVIFEHAGVIQFYRNDSLIEKADIHLQSSEQYSSGYSFDFLVEGDPHKRIHGITDGVSLLTYDFPYQSEEPPCNDYTNYFEIEP